jgi:hypothetical protein
MASAMIACSRWWPLIGSVAMCSTVRCLLAESGMAVAHRAAAGSLLLTKSGFGGLFDVTGSTDLESSVGAASVTVRQRDLRAHTGPVRA